MIRLVTLIIFCLFMAPNLTYGFGGKPKHFSQIKGTSEVQVKTDPETGVIKVFLRGKAAESTYNKLDFKEEIKSDSAVFKFAKTKNLIHWVKTGKQINCAKVQEIKGEKRDYACEFNIDLANGKVAKSDPFTSTDFNYAQTKTAAKFFKKTGGRSLASATHSYGSVSAFLVSKSKKSWKEKEDTLVVVKGAPAKSILNFLQEQKSTNVKNNKGSRIQQSKYIGCVEANSVEAERCALVISMKDGSISSSKNPLLP